MSKRVHLVQLLCPARHCVVAGAYEDDAHTLAEISAQIEAQFTNGTLNRRCELCQSRELHFEEGRTSFRSMAEAAPALGALVLANLATRAHFLAGQGRGRN